MCPNGNNDKDVPDCVAVAIIEASREETFREMSRVKDKADKIADERR